MNKVYSKEEYASRGRCGIIFACQFCNEYKKKPLVQAAVVISSRVFLKRNWIGQLHKELYAQHPASGSFEFGLENVNNLPYSALKLVGCRCIELICFFC
jgi:hypothetical protein